MSTKLRVAYVAHSISSDWNNGNAHFLRGLMREMGALGHEVTIFESAGGWSPTNLALEELGEHSMQQFRAAYSDLDVRAFPESLDREELAEALRGFNVVVLHEWTTPEISSLLRTLRPELGFSLLFHDTHHRASSSPASIAELGLEEFDGIIAFGDVLRRIYLDRFGLKNVWTLHEAADTRVFKPLPRSSIGQDVVWIGNWGDDERSRELHEFLLNPAREMPGRAFTVYGVRYPEEGLQALQQAGVTYRGYLPNLDAPGVYAESRLTVHVPRRQYANEMVGIPTIRVFEALACGIPLISAPWQDAEHLFRPGDFATAASGIEMTAMMRRLLSDEARAQDQAARGLETVLARHTCAHRARELTGICEEVLP